MSKGYGAGTVFRVTKIRQGKPVTVHVGQWERPPMDGKRRRGSVSGATAAEAWRKMRAAQQREGRSNSRLPRRTESVSTFLEGWLTDVVARTRRERTLVGYRAIIAAAMPVLGETSLADPRLGHHVQVFINGLDRHPRTVHHYAACLRTAFAYAVRKGMMERNPALDLDLPAIPRTERIPLTADELRAFLAAAEGPLAPLWITAAWTGLRQGELLALRWEDVSLDRASLVVRKSLTRLPPLRAGGHVRYVLTEPKTERSRRTVPLVPDVVNALRPLRKAYLAGKPPLDQNLVFATASGSPLDAAWVNREFGRALGGTGTRAVRMHDLRHSAATLWIQSGMDLATVSTLLGHSNISTTVDVYGHIGESHRAEAMQRFVESLA